MPIFVSPLAQEGIEKVLKTDILRNTVALRLGKTTWSTTLLASSIPEAVQPKLFKVVDSQADLAKLTGK